MIPLIARLLPLRNAVTADDMGLALLFITHNLALIRTIADRVAAMGGEPG